MPGYVRHHEPIGGSRERRADPLLEIVVEFAHVGISFLSLDIARAANDFTVP
jgi:hypothetical protein